MQVIKIAPLASQKFNAVLAGQNCQINVYQKSSGVFLDLALDNTPVITGRLCRDRVRLVRQPYLGFVGDLVFCDTQGVIDPDYSGFGSRYLLCYLEASDL